MANKIYLADKPTLDKVDATTENTNGKVGKTEDVGGSASAGTVYGKLNAVIVYLLGHVTTSLTNIGNYAKRLNDLFPDARVAKIDKLDGIDTNVTATKSSAYNAEQNSYQSALNTATNNAASATGTLSQKLSKVLSDIASLPASVAARQKVLVSKRTAVKIAPAGTHTLVDVTGAGVFYGGYTQGSDITGATVIVDGVAHGLGRPSNAYYIVRLLSIDVGFAFQSNLGAMIPVHFKNSLKITISQGSNSMTSSYICDYALYE